jgi:hypothetical protein
MHAWHAETTSGCPWVAFNSKKEKARVYPVRLFATHQTNHHISSIADVACHTYDPDQAGFKLGSDLVPSTPSNVKDIMGLPIEGKEVNMASCGREKLGRH